MKNVVSAIVVSCAMSVAVGVSAQGQPGSQGTEPRTTPPATSTQSPQEPRAGAQRPADQKVTISGCIQNAPAATGTAASATAPKFVLNNAKAASGAGAVGTSGTTAASKYRLEGDDKTISPHLNHQVEITGTVQNSSASATGAGAGAASSAAAEPMLKVDSLKMLSAMCQ
jgi:hypothetical protein